MNCRYSSLLCCHAVSTVASTSYASTQWTLHVHYKIYSWPKQQQCNKATVWKTPLKEEAESFAQECKMDGTLTGIKSAQDGINMITALCINQPYTVRGSVTGGLYCTANIFLTASHWECPVSQCPETQFLLPATKARALWRKPGPVHTNIRARETTKPKNQGKVQMKYALTQNIMLNPNIKYLMQQLTSCAL